MRRNGAFRLARVSATAWRVTAATAIGLGLAAAPAVAATTVSSTFDAGSEGWGHAVVHCNDSDHRADGPSGLAADRRQPRRLRAHGRGG